MIMLFAAANEAAHRGEKQTSRTPKTVLKLPALRGSSFRRAMLAHEPPRILWMRVRPSSKQWGSQAAKNSIKKTLSLNQTS